MIILRLNFEANYARRALFWRWWRERGKVVRQHVCVVSFGVDVHLHVRWRGDSQVQSCLQVQSSTVTVLVTGGDSSCYWGRKGMMQVDSSIQGDDQLISSLCHVLSSLTSLG